MQPETRHCQNCKQSFEIDGADVSFYEKLKVPSPTWCPQCRFQRRALFRNERKLFRNVDTDGNAIITLIPKESGLLVHEDTKWFGGDWDPYEYGQEFDRNRPFLAQLYELSRKVPYPRSNMINDIRSDYCANASNLKDCYLCFNSNGTEDSGYSNGLDASKFCYDCSHTKYAERCYESFWLTKCYDTHFSTQCDDCVSVWFSKNCRGCNDCFGCVNLAKKSYCFFNEQLTKEEYQKRIAELKLSTWEGSQRAKEEARKFWLQFPVKYFQGVNNHNATGEYVTHAKNIKKGYLIREGEDLSYVQYGQVPPVKDCMDTTITGSNTELQYETVTSGWNSVQLKYCWECWDGGLDFEYCMYSGRQASHLFGCVGVGVGEYAILNKKYSKEEFLKLKEEIKKHMDEMPYLDEQGREYKYGEFFPPHFSPFAYNDTIAAEHFPLSGDEILAYGGRYYEVPKTEYNTTIKASELPETADEATDSLFKETIACADCGRAYRIIPQELQFLQQNKLPLPHECVDCRHKKRISQRNKSKLYQRTCMCNTNTAYQNQGEHFHGINACPNTFETSYASDRPEIVYCGECYQQEVN